MNHINNYYLHFMKQYLDDLLKQLFAYDQLHY